MRSLQGPAQAIGAMAWTGQELAMVSITGARGFLVPIDANNVRLQRLELVPALVTLPTQSTISGSAVWAAKHHRCVCSHKQSCSQLWCHSSRLAASMHTISGSAVWAAKPHGVYAATSKAVLSCGATGAALQAACTQSQAVLSGYKPP